jgi:hypothetical protein
VRVFFVAVGGFAVAALLVGRGWFVIVPIIAWPLYFVGLSAGWWGTGAGLLLRRIIDRYTQARSG